MAAGSDDEDRYAELLDGLTLPGPAAPAARARPTRARQLGYGLQPTAASLALAPKDMELGKIVVDLTALRRKPRQIVVKSALTGRGVAGIPRTRVSDDFAKIFLNRTLPQGTKYGIHLTPDEFDLWEKIIRSSGVELPADRRKVYEAHRDALYGDVETLRRRLSILVGERESGNGAPEILDELGEVLDRLVDLKRLTRARADALLNAAMAIEPREDESLAPS